MKQQLPLRFLPFLLFPSIGFLQGLQPIGRPDLGWHLAGGLWILETGSFPSEDPFHVASRFWLCYSWIFEVLIARIYELAGFHGLRLFQALGNTIAILGIVVLVRETSSPKSCSARTIVVEAIALTLLLPLTAPIWYLRPQLFSLALLCLLVILQQRRELKFVYVFPLAVVWANLHVYWLFVPLVVGLSRVVLPDRAVSSLESRVRGGAIACSCFLAGLLNPYGVEHLKGMFEYVFSHRSGYALIKEFQPLSMEVGFAFWMFVVFCVLSSGYILSYMRKSRKDEIVLFLVFLVAGVCRVKFLPLFAVVAVPFVVREVAPSIARFFGLSEGDNVGEEARNFINEHEKRRIGVSLLLFCLFYGAVVVYDFLSQPSVEPRRLELIELAEDLEDLALFDKEPEVVVLNHFDDGGWLDLAFWLSRREGTSENRFKTLIDGRTLVMGQERLRDYDLLRRRKSGWRKILSKWSPQVVILSREDLLGKQLRGVYSVFRETKYWQVLVLPNAVNGP